MGILYGILIFFFIPYLNTFSTARKLNMPMLLFMPVHVSNACSNVIICTEPSYYYDQKINNTDEYDHGCIAENDRLTIVCSNDECSNGERLMIGQYPRIDIDIQH